MGYDPKETDSLYKHIPFYIKLNPGTKKAVGYFYHCTSKIPGFTLGDTQTPRFFICAKKSLGFLKRFLFQVNTQRQ